MRPLSTAPSVLGSGHDLGYFLFLIHVNCVHCRRDNYLVTGDTSPRAQSSLYMLLQRTGLCSAVKLSIGFTITEKAPTRAFSWLKVPTSTFTFKTLLRLVGAFSVIVQLHRLFVYSTSCSSRTPAPSPALPSLQRSHPLL